MIEQNISGTITTGGSAQVLASADTYRNGWSLRNNSSGSLFINRWGVAASGSNNDLEIKSGEYYESPNGVKCANALSIYGATTGQGFTATTW